MVAEWKEQQRERPRGWNLHGAYREQHGRRRCCSSVIERQRGRREAVRQAGLLGI